jgi:hypothetical protein
MSADEYSKEYRAVIAEMLASESQSTAGWLLGSNY